MLSDNQKSFTKENLDMYFKELSKVYKKLGGRDVSVEIILIGGAAIIEKYSFRDMTTDIDAIIPMASVMKEAINIVGDKFDLPRGWLNDNFIKTTSYSKHLYQYAVYYKTFNQVLNVRVITGEYLIAMKLKSGRKYKNDLSDIVGILAEHENIGQSISYDMINNAVKNLYGGWYDFPKDSISFISTLFKLKNYRELYSKIMENEARTKKMLVDFQVEYPGVMNRDNIDYIIETKTQHESRQTVLAQLNAMKEQYQQ